MRLSVRLDHEFSGGSASQQMLGGRRKLPGDRLVEAGSACGAVDEVDYVRKLSDARAPRLEVRRVASEGGEGVGDRVEKASPVEIALGVNGASWASGVNVSLPRRPLAVRWHRGDGYEFAQLRPR